MDGTKRPGRGGWHPSHGPRATLSVVRDEEERGSEMSKTAVQGLVGPCADEAWAIVERGLALTLSEAQEVTRAWNPDAPEAVVRIYLENCRVVWKALESSERMLPLGWFEATFADVEWLETTKALHAIADAVVATLVRDKIPADVYDSLMAPWRKVVEHNIL